MLEKGLLMFVFLFFFSMKNLKDGTKQVEYYGPLILERYGYTCTTIIILSLAKRTVRQRNNGWTDREVVK